MIFLGYDIASVDINNCLQLTQKYLNNSPYLTQKYARRIFVSGQYLFRVFQE